MTAKCYDPGFRYTRSADTNISKTFARIRKQMKAAEASKNEAQKKAAQIKRPGK